MIWIRTQDKERLLYINGFYIEGKKIEYHLPEARNFFTLGTYATKERCMEVLDEIEKAVLGKVFIPTQYLPYEKSQTLNNNQIAVSGDNVQIMPIVYHMPKE